jgi:cyclic pyranopterin phosphate synthase
VANIWNRRDDRYSELRASLSPDANAKTQRVEMSYIGG